MGLLLRFTGRRFDNVLRGMGSNGGDIGYFRARWYDSGAGRWLQADPMGMVDGPNRYAYAENSPALLKDPSGWSSYFSGYGMFQLESDVDCGMEPFQKEAELAALDALLFMMLDIRARDMGFEYVRGTGEKRVFRFSDDWELFYGPTFWFSKVTGDPRPETRWHLRDGQAEIMTRIRADLVLDPLWTMGLPPKEFFFGVFVHEWVHYSALMTAGPPLTNPLGDLFIPTRYTHDGIDYSEAARVGGVLDTLSEHAGYAAERRSSGRNPNGYPGGFGWLQP